MKQTNNETGRTMVEMLGVLAIIGVLTIGAISAVNMGIQFMRVSTVFSQVEDTAQGVADLYSWKRAYPKTEEADDMKTLVCRNVFATGGPAYSLMECTGGPHAAIKTPWGKLQVSPTKEGNGESFTVTLTDVPYQPCNQLLTMDWTTVQLDTKECNGEGEKTDITFTVY